MIPEREALSTSSVPALLQVGALPLRFEDGRAQVLLLTSRETKRWIIPKGWPMKGRKNWAAAAQEAKEEAGIVGRTDKKPIGSFLYFKRRAAHFDLCRVDVFVLSFDKRLDEYKEKGQREARWFPIEEAAELVEEPGLAALLRNLDIVRFAKPRRAKRAGGRSRKKRR
jgi:8-oxo-dGTP pyrophosphatase MutT (NUDIX family)